MKPSLKTILITSAAAGLLISCKPSENMTVAGPDGNISVSLHITDSGEIFYDALCKGSPVLLHSRLGITMDDADFTSGLSLQSISPVEKISGSYALLHGKKKEASYEARSIIFHLTNTSNDSVDIIFQVHNDGFAFRYHFPEGPAGLKKIVRETTSFNFTGSARAWIQPRAKSKTGWNQVNPSYEEHYWKDTLLAGILPNDSGWVFPALVHTPDCWVNLTETWPMEGYCGSHLNKGSQQDELVISFPEKTEGYTGSAVYPESALPWSTPWRVVTIGTLATIAESTLGMDLAEPSVLDDVSYVKPGRASWSWALMKDPSVNFKVQKSFIEYAAAMGWEYCLVDVNWDTQIGWSKIEELAKLATQSDVSLILWYNSAGDWNTVPYHPKDILNNKESREKEFARLQDLGIKGIKVDFFGGDGQSMMAYYRDILESAHKYRLVVNCHGATLPRGLQRTYPNLVSMESIRGFEYATFGQETADKVPSKATIIPFTRNAFDPMDFTPVCFTEYDNQKRATGNAAELAMAVLFLSGVQHYAETPAGMSEQPDYVKDMMREIPVSWDETRFVDGYPGKYIILARRKGITWFIAGINAEKKEKSFTISFPFLTSSKAFLVTEGDSLRSFTGEEISLTADKSVSLNLLPNGGFVMKTLPQD
jgi:alpha-glucosidase